MQENMDAEVLTKRIISLYHDRGRLIDALEAEQSGNGLQNVLDQIYKHTK